MHSNGVDFSSELTYCDGSDQVIFDARFCTIPAAVLRDTPFNLAQGDAISPIIRF